MNYQQLKQIVFAGRKFNKDLNINGFMYIGDNACLMKNNEIVATIPRSQWDTLLGPYDHERENQAIEDSIKKRYNKNME